MCEALVQSQCYEKSRCASHVGLASILIKMLLLKYNVYIFNCSSTFLIDLKTSVRNVLSQDGWYSLVCQFCIKISDASTQHNSRKHDTLNNSCKTCNYSSNLNR